MLSYDLGFMPHRLLRDGVSDRVMREMCRFAKAYRRVSQSRICTTVLLPAQKIAWGWAGGLRPLRDVEGRVTNQPGFLI